MGQGDDLLFARFTPTNAYLIAVLPHGPSTFGARSIVEMIYRNWPDDGLVMVSSYATGLSQHYSDDDRFRVQEAGAVFFAEVDGKVVGPPGGGQTMDGGSVQVARYVNGFNWELAELRRKLEGDPQYLDTFVPTDRRDCPGPIRWAPTLYEGRYGYVSPAGLFVAVTTSSPLVVSY